MKNTAGRCRTVGDTTSSSSSSCSQLRESGGGVGLSVGPTDSRSENISIEISVRNDGDNDRDNTAHCTAGFERKLKTDSCQCKAQLSVISLFHFRKDEAQFSQLCHLPGSNCCW